MSKKHQDAISIHSIEDMYQIAQDVPLDCEIFISDDETEKLFTLLSRTDNPDIYDAPIQSNIITNENLQYNNCELNRLYTENGLRKWDKYRIIIFPNCSETIEKYKDDPVIVGFIQYSDNQGNVIVPLGVLRNDPTINMGNVYIKRGKIIRPYNLHSRITESDFNNAICVLAIWGCVQLSSTNSFMNDLFVKTETKVMTTYKLNEESLTKGFENIS